MSYGSPPSIGPSMQPNNPAEQLVMTLTGIRTRVGERQHRFERLIARCRGIGEELSIWSAMWNTPGLRVAGTAVQTTITTVQHECQDWQRRWIVQRMARDDYIQGDLVAWDQALRECMEDYNRSLLHEILLSDREVVVRLLTQEAASLSLRSMSETATPDIRSQLQDLNDTGYQASRSEILSRAARDAIFESLRTMLTIDNVPTSVQLQGELRINAGSLVINVGSDIRQAKWRNQIVAVKCLRDPNPTPQRENKFLYEAAIWRMLDHPNVLPFYGIYVETYEDRKTIALVSQWVDYQDVLKFIQKFPDRDRREIIKGTSYGIAYLHRRKIVHGAIRGSNILIGNDGRALLTDFGLASASGVDREALNEGLSSSETSTTIRWMAPELTMGTRIPSPASDVFSFARTILEILTGDKPFKEKKNTWELASLLNQGRLIPVRSQDPQVGHRGLTDDVWELLLDMWSTQPEERPKMSEVVERLEELM